MDPAALTMEQKLEYLVQFEEAVYESMEEDFMYQEKVMFPFLDSHVIRWKWIDFFRRHYGYHLKVGSCKKGIYRRLI